MLIVYRFTIIIEYETSSSASALQWLTAEQTCGKKYPYLFSQGQVSTFDHHKFIWFDGDLAIFSVRPSTPFSVDTDTPIFCCQSNTIPIFDFLICFKSGRGATWLTDQRLQTLPPQLITAVAPRTRCSAAADAFDLSWTVKHSNYQ